MNIYDINMKNKKERLGQTITNYQNCLMKIIEYNTSQDILIEFQDEYRFQKKSTYKDFKNGSIKNPYYPSVCNIGMIGSKYKTSQNGKHFKEYVAWKSMLSRCYSGKLEVYKDVIVCDEWLLYENFYEWLHSQDNFDKWYRGERWVVDKDILVKGNKIYSPETCCLVPYNVNLLFTKADKLRTEVIGVIYREKVKMYEVNCCNPYIYSNAAYLGRYKDRGDAFKAYKNYKENVIKQVAQEEYSKGNITKRCYEAMMNYQVEITD